MEQKNSKKKADDAASKGVVSVISAELELNGRRLVVMEAMSRENASNGV